MSIQQRAVQSVLQSMVPLEASSDQQFWLQNSSRCGRERYKEVYNPTETNNNQQQAIRTKTPPYTNKAPSFTRMPSAEPLVREAARPGSSRNLCMQCEGPLQR
jgi:hypothetical protein